MTGPAVNDPPTRQPPRRPPRPRSLRPTALTAFLGVLAVVLAAYTQVAMGMEWRSEAGRIGAGFFPRVIGILGVVLCCAGAVRSLRPDGRAATADDEDAGDGRHPWVLAGAVAALAALTLLLVPLGAILASALFTLAFVKLLGRSRLRSAIALSILVPLAMYLLLETLLKSGLPEGVLPMPF